MEAPKERKGNTFERKWSRALVVVVVVVVIPAVGVDYRIGFECALSRKETGTSAFGERASSSSVHDPAWMDGVCDKMMISLWTAARSKS